MRRPTTEEDQGSDGDNSMRCADGILPVREDKHGAESRFAKVKRILSGTLSLGRSHERELKQKRNENSHNHPVKCSSTSKAKAARKRDHSQEHPQECGDTTDKELCMKQTKLVEYVGNQNPSSAKKDHPAAGPEKNVRKRKERHESISSTTQERKLVRSNSEERPLDDIHKESTNIKDIRRVSSHEDFKKNAESNENHPVKTEAEHCKVLSPIKKIPLQEVNINDAYSIDIQIGNLPENQPTKHITEADNTPLHDLNNTSQHARNSPSKISPNRDPKSHFFSEQKFLSDFETEHEKRRMSERFARPLAPRGRSKATTKKRKSNKDKFHPSDHHSKLKHKDTDGEPPCKTEDRKSRSDSSKSKAVDSESQLAYREFDDVTKTTLRDDNKVLIYETKSWDSDEGVHGPDAHKREAFHEAALLLATASIPERHVKSQRTPKHDPDIHILPLDLNTLHEQIDSAEPIPMRSNHLFTANGADAAKPTPSIAMATNCAILSPRNSLILTRKVYLDPVVPIQLQNKVDLSTSVMNSVSNPLEARMKQLTKQINSLKKKLKKLEEHTTDPADGSKPNERMNDKKHKGIVTEINKLKKELKCLKCEPIQTMYSATRYGDGRHGLEDINVRKRVEQIKETLIDVQKRLSEKRQHANRSETINEMTDDQLVDEKVAVQKALLHLESVHGRPVGKEDRDVVRPLYDRYRVLKRMVIRATNAKLNSSITELGTILEHETMNFVSSPIQETGQKVDDTESPTNTPAASVDSSDTDTSISENLHALPLADLLEQQSNTREEKKRVRRTLKEFEHEFEQKTGRKLQKDDKTPMESNYTIYKQIKAKLKLLDILIAKKRNQMLQDENSN